MLEFSSQTVARYRSSMSIKLKRPWKDDSLLEITAITISLWNSSSVKQSVDLLVLRILELRATAEQITGKIMYLRLQP